MRIGIDVDDTITNSYDYIIEKVAEYYNINHNELLKRNMPYEAFYNNDEFPNYSIYVEENYARYINAVPTKEDVVDVLNKLSDEGHKIIIITARHVGEYDNPYEVTQNYLLKHQIPFDKIIVGALDKGKVCVDENIDLFIDDSIGNCMKVSEYDVPTLLFDARFNRDNKDFKRVYSWKEIYDIINSENDK